MTKKTRNNPVKVSKNTQQSTLSLHFHSSCWTWLGMGVAGTILILDQLSKWAVLNHLMVPPQPLPVTSFFNIVLVWNRGVSFGLLSSNHPYGVWTLTAIGVVLAVVLTLWVWQARTKTIALAFGFVLGGAIGNLSDRVRFGAVTDFLDFHAYGYHWYTFNIADTAIVIGVALIALEYLKEMWSESRK